MDQSEGVEEWERVGVQPVALTELVASASPTELVTSASPTELVASASPTDQKGRAW